MALPSVGNSTCEKSCFAGCLSSAIAGFAGGIGVGTAAAGAGGIGALTTGAGGGIMTAGAGSGVDITGGVSGAGGATDDGAGDEGTGAATAAGWSVCAGGVCATAIRSAMAKPPATRMKVRAKRAAIRMTMVCPIYRFRPCLSG